MVNIAVLVSGGGTNLQALLDAAPYENGCVRVVAASRAAAPALERARKAGVETIVARPKDYESREAYTDALIEQFEARDIGLCVTAGFMYVLSPRFSEVYLNRVINVHPALIPSFCGMGFFGLRVHEAVLDYGVKLTGATVHFVTAKTDAGPVIAQKATEVLPGDTPESLQRRVMECCEWPLLTGAVRDFCAGRLRVEGRQVIRCDRA